MPFKKICLITFIYFWLCLGKYLSAPVENTTFFEPNLLDDVENNYVTETDEDMADDEDSLTTPGINTGIEGSPGDEVFKRIGMIFISKEESNSFLHHRSKRASKVKDTGPKTYDQCKNSLYRSFKYMIPERNEWWPVFKGPKAFENCIKENGCVQFNEVWEYYDSSYNNGQDWTYEIASVIYRYNLCLRGSSIATNCPYPCKRNPCSGSHMTKCKETGSLLTRNYFCVCETGWNYNSKTKKCDDVAVCKTSMSKCVVANTERCVEGVGLAHKCECKIQWAGDKCSNQYDACIDFNNPCGNHGMCVPHKGQQTWTCNCDDGWGDDPNHSGRDCNKKDDPCESLVCRNGGECQRSTSYSSAYCQCPELYTGNVCQERKPQWNPWQHWSDCDVTCGTGGKQTRVRTCDHAGADYCGGGYNNGQQACSGPICMVNGEWGAWTKMTGCSHNCDGGKYLRARNCEYDNADPDTYGDPCKGEILSYEDCNIGSCPSKVKRKKKVDIESLARSILAETGIAEGDWGAWNSWTSCTETCGEGFQQRGRTCLNSLGTCEGQSEEFEDCYDVACEEEHEFLPWSSWSVWSMCGPMTSKCTRTRHCPYGTNEKASAKACPGESSDSAPCRYSSCTGEAPADLVDVASVMGGNAAMQVQMGNMHAAGLPPYSYLNAAAPSFVAAPMPMAPVAMAPVYQAPMAPVAQAPVAPGYPGYPPNPAAPNLHGYPAPPSANQAEYEKETISAAGALGGVVVFALLICCCCCIKKKFGNKGDTQTSASGYETKTRTGNDYY